MEEGPDQVLIFTEKRVIFYYAITYWADKCFKGKNRNSKRMLMGKDIFIKYRSESVGQTRLGVWKV